MIEKYTDSSYKHSHKKNEKSFAKLLDIRPQLGQNSQPHSLTASQPHSLTASQLRPSHAQINLQSNTNKFTHIKNRNVRQALSFAQLRKGLLRIPLQRLP